MRILATDYGRKRIGVAVSDDMLLTAHGLDTIENNGQFLERLEKIISEYDPVMLVVGDPQREDGSESEMGREARAFRLSLEKTFGIETRSWDESFSSFAADAVLMDAGKDGRKRRKLTDRVAAAIFLQDFLDANRDELIGKEE